MELQEKKASSQEVGGQGTQDSERSEAWKNKLR